MRVAWRPDRWRLDAALATAVAQDPTSTCVPAAPGGGRTLDQATPIGHGADAWRRAGAALLRWDLQRVAGLAVVASHDGAVPGATIVSVTPWPLALLVPCRVTDRFEGADAIGFTYATLPGHPLHGVERFAVERAPDDRVALRITSCSRLAGVSRLAPPLARAGQWAWNRHYAAVASDLATLPATAGGAS